LRVSPLDAWTYLAVAVILAFVAYRVSLAMVIAHRRRLETHPQSK